MQTFLLKELLDTGCVLKTLRFDRNLQMGPVRQCVLIAKSHLVLVSYKENELYSTSLVYLV